MCIRDRLQGSEVTLVSANIAGVSVIAGQVLHVRLQCQGASPTTLRAKVWNDGAAEPGWQVTTTDSQAELQDAGGVGVVTYLAGSATTGAAVVSFDNLSAGPIAP